MAARDIIQAAAGAAGATQANYIEDCFSCHLYTGNGSTQTINNGIDLATKGGLVWIKIRDSDYNHCLIDTAQGTSKVLFSSTTSQSTNTTADVTAFNTTGFTVGSNGRVNQGINATSFTSWTFRKQPKFFDIVTFTAAGSNAEALPHSLGVVPGMVILKKTNAVDAWYIKHRGITGNIDGGYLFLNNPNQANIYSYGTSTSSTVNLAAFVTTGDTYVAYLFAHDTSTDGLIQCGNYTGNGSASGPTVTLGWEPQFVMIKNTSATGDWNIFDNMRGIATGGNDPYLFANSSVAEATTNGDLIDLTPTGFVIKSTNSQVNTSGNNYIYLAIRRGPMKTPTDATKVFSPNASSASVGTNITTGFPIDLQIMSQRGVAGKVVNDRLRGVSSSSTESGRFLNTTLTDAENATINFTHDWSNVGFKIITNWSGLSAIYWNFRRAPGFFDVVCYTGDGTSIRQLNHSLSVAPEMIICKNRNTASTNWMVGHTALGFDTLSLNSTAIGSGTYTVYVPQATTTTFKVVNSGSIAENSNQNGANFVAYLFATCPGVSKVFSFTGNGSSQTIDCGFTSGARFVLIKRTDSTGDWYVWDTARGINPGNDPHLSLNSTAAEVTTNDTIDTAGSGFIVNQVAATNVNVNNATYIGLAIA